MWGSVKWRVALSDRRVFHVNHSCRRATIFFAGVGAGGCCVANRVRRLPLRSSHFWHPSEQFRGWEIIKAGPYLSTNHHTRTLAISSANSTKTATRTAMNSSFVSLCAATSFSYAPLKLLIRPSAGGCGLYGLIPLPLQLGCSKLQLRHVLLQLAHGTLKLVLPGDGPAQQLLVAQVLRPAHPHEHRRPSRTTSIVDRQR